MAELFPNYKNLEHALSEGRDSVIEPRLHRIIIHSVLAVPANGANFPCLLARHVLGQHFTIPGLSVGATMGFFARNNFSLAVDQHRRQRWLFCDTEPLTLAVNKSKRVMVTRTTIHGTQQHSSTMIPK